MRERGEAKRGNERNRVHASEKKNGKDRSGRGARRYKERGTHAYNMGVSSATLSSYPHRSDTDSPVSLVARPSSTARFSHRAVSRAEGFRAFSLRVFRRFVVHDARASRDHTTNFRLGRRIFAARLAELPATSELRVRMIARGLAAVRFFWLARRVAHFRHGHMCTSCGGKVSEHPRYRSSSSRFVYRTSSACFSTSQRRD